MVASPVMKGIEAVKSNWDVFTYMGVSINGCTPKMDGLFQGQTPPMNSIKKDGLSPSSLSKMAAPGRDFSWPGVHPIGQRSAARWTLVASLQLVGPSW